MAAGRGLGLHVGIVLALVAAQLALYAGSLELGFFHWDDPHYVVDNPWIRGVRAENLRFLATRPYRANYSPMHLASYLLDHAVGGLDPQVYHLSSHLWAAAGALGVYGLGLLWLGSPWAAGLAAGLFVVHPAHVEAVVWISSRKDLVATAFALPAVAAYVLARRSAGRRRWAWWTASLALYILAVAGKTSAAVVPGVLGLLDLACERRRDPGLVLDKLPYVAVTLWIGWQVAGAQPDTGLGFDLSVLVRSLAQSLWLLGGLGDYVLARPRPEAGWGAFAAWLSLATVVAAWAAPLLWWRRAPLACVLSVWAVAALLPPQVLHLVHPVSDRYLYLSSAPWVLLLVWAGLQGRGRLAGARRGAPAALALGLTVVWAGQTLSTIGTWRDPRSVWHAAARAGGDLRAHYSLGAHYQEEADRVLAGTGPGDRDARKALARRHWRGDPRLEGLLAEQERQRARWIPDLAERVARAEARCATAAPAGSG